MFTVSRNQSRNTLCVTHSLYAVITLQESSELTVIPTNWLNEHKTQCYWPPFKAPKTCTEAVKNRLEPARGENPWEMLNIIFHEEHGKDLNDSLYVMYIILFFFSI